MIACRKVLTRDIFFAVMSSECCFLHHYKDQCLLSSKPSRIMKLWSLQKLVSSKSISLFNPVYAIPWKYCYWTFSHCKLSMLVTRHVFLLYYFPGFHISNTWSWVSFYRNILIRMPWAEASWKSSAKPPLGGLSSTPNWRGQKETYNALRTLMRSRQAPKVRSTAFLDHFLSRDHSSTDIKLIPLELILSAELRARCENWNTSFREGSNLWTGWSIDAKHCKLCLHMFGHFSFIVIHPYYFALCIGILNCKGLFVIVYLSCYFLHSRLSHRRPRLKIWPSTDCCVTITI